jgi:putative hydrolase of the HAD superfamily
VTFDCAETLLRVEWQPEAFALSCAARAGIEVPPGADRAYASLYESRLPKFLEVNRTGDPDLGQAFYEELAGDWLERLGLDRRLADSLMDASEDLAYGPESTLCRPFEDALPAVLAVKALGLKTAVISNWDFTLERTLDGFGFTDHLDFSLASLVEGVEKPDPRLFEIALRRLGVQASETLHIGDNPVDDYAGALGAGLQACLLDRSKAAEIPCRIQSLLQVPEAIAWLA